MERFINLLIIDDNEKTQRGLAEILAGGGNNITGVESYKEALPILEKKEIGIVIINIDTPLFTGFELFKTIKQASVNKSVYTIAITDNTSSAVKMVKGLSQGAIDYITKPFNPNLILAKIEIYKTLYYKDQRINQLLNNIFPATVLEDLNTYGKFSPKRVDQGVVIFTDFVNFSQKASKIKPLRLLKKLEHYFTEFDQIMGRYKLEKIKTIGDSYMVLGGVTENNHEPVIRACLAALEMRNFMMNEKTLAEAMKTDYWEIRVGLHVGPIVAGIIGTKKFSFDVWGDTVNIASRAEQSGSPNTITITRPIANIISNYFDFESRGQIEIKKRGGSLEMFFLNQLKKDYSLYKEGKIASQELFEKCDLSSIDFHHMRKDILNNMKAKLSDDLHYHNIAHTLNVEKAALRFAKLEGLNEEELKILQTAVLYHDTGFMFQYDNNEEMAAKLAEKNLPKYGYSKEQIEEIKSIIMATKMHHKPFNLLEQIMCDADHDYFGRPDYYSVSLKLRKEMEIQGLVHSYVEWVEVQIDYLENKHEYYTQTAINIRGNGKEARLNELKKEYHEINQSINNIPSNEKTY
jgi:adenylate cyclase